MLVLTRKVGDVIAIGDNIKVIVMGIKGKQVRLGIEADRSTVVHREEIYQKIKQETAAASNSTKESSSRAHELFKDEKDEIIKEIHSGDKKKTIIIRKNNP